MKYRKKPVIIEAVQWFKNGDHPDDNCKFLVHGISTLIKIEGALVRFYRTPELDGEIDCKCCGKGMKNHGWIDTLEGGHIVCPADFIITGVSGEHYPCKPAIFEATYEAVDNE